VLRVDFITHGMQLVSAASDGLVKLWNIRDEECVTSLDNHEDKVGSSTLDTQFPGSYSDLGFGRYGLLQSASMRQQSYRALQILL
jgi:WD40 repeat protein